MAVFIRATAAVLLSTGPLSFARGSVSSSRGHEVLSEFSSEVVRGTFGQIRAQTLKYEDLPSASTGTTTTTTGRPGGDRIHADVPGNRLKLSSEMGLRLAINSRRNLQESECADGTTSIIVSSTVFPLMEGCFSPVVVNGTLLYKTDTAFIFPLEPVSTSELPIWLAAYEASADEFTLACISEEGSDEVDPSEATWFCDTNGDGSAFILADDQLSVSCGCPISFSLPLTTPAPTQSDGTTCGDGDTFTIVSEGFPEAEGCFVDTGEFYLGQAIYSASGTTDLGQVFVWAVEWIVDDSSSIVWAVVYIDAATSTSAFDEVYCTSLSEAALHHPSQVPVWQCDVDGDGVPAPVGGEVVSFSCGCSITPPLAETPAPMLSTSTSTSSTCSEGTSFSIASETLPGAEGCYLDTDYVSNNQAVYTTSGTIDVGQIWMFAPTFIVDDSSTEVSLWALVMVISTTTAEGSTIYCHSSGEAGLYHPSDVPVWACDEGIFISLTCGCSGSPAPVASSLELPSAAPTSATPTSPTAQPAVSDTSRGLPTPGPSPTTSPTAEPAFSGFFPPTATLPPAAVGGPAPSSSACSGDGSFTITADAAPELSGCFKDTGTSSPTVPAAYTVSGTRDVAEVVVFSVVNDEGDFNWFIAYDPFGADNVEENTRYYCVSREQADLVDPSSASWNCKFTEGGEAPSVASEDDISVVCGACTVPTADANASTTLVVGVVAAGGAGIVVAVSAFAGW